MLAINQEEGKRNTRCFADLDSSIASDSVKFGSEWMGWRVEMF